VRQALQSRSSGGGGGGEGGVGGGGGENAAGVFVFYRGVVPFLILGLTEDEGVRDKFGPSIFFLRITVFRGGDDEWVHILSKVTIQYFFFCSTQKSVLKKVSIPGVFFSRWSGTDFYLFTQNSILKSQCTVSSQKSVCSGFCSRWYGHEFCSRWHDHDTVFFFVLLKIYFSKFSIAMTFVADGMFCVIL
jgi:hypothetical protein